MRQVFANLLDNAIKYTPAGGLVSISADHHNGKVEVIFRDTGRGISRTDLPRIWERLYRGDKSRSQQGLGLGLSLVKAIVHAHGGWVEVTSEEGKGTEFRVFLSLQPQLQHAR
jgi:signal transduction histidine kinase